MKYEQRPNDYPAAPQPPSPGLLHEPKLDSTRSTSVDPDYFWRSMITCPRGVKVQLLGKGKVAVYGQYNGADSWWLGWAPLPKIDESLL